MKVGDSVIIFLHEGSEDVDYTFYEKCHLKKGRIISIDDSGKQPFRVCISDGSHEYFDEHELCPIEVESE